MSAGCIPDKRGANDEEGWQEHVEEAGVDIPVKGDVESGRGVDMSCAVVCPVEVTILSELVVANLILCGTNP